MHAMAENAPKKRCVELSCDEALVRLHRGPNISESALASTLRFVRDHGLPARFSRSSQVRARQKEAQVKTAYGPVLNQFVAKTRGADDVTFWFAHPLALLHRTVEECPHFRELLRGKLAQFPCSVSQPWRIIIYFDEVTPTDPTSTKEDKHKIQGLYLTFVVF